MKQRPGVGCQVTGVGCWGLGAGRLTLACLIVALLCPSSGSPNTQHPTPNTRPKLVVVVANRLILSDLSDPNLPSITKLLTVGSVGLVSPNCGKPRSENAVLMTASAGAGCSGGGFVQDCYDTDETTSTTGENAGVAYSARTGHRPPKGSAVYLGLGQSIRTIGQDGQPVQPGAIGDALHRAGMRTCAIGNADLDPGSPNRAAAVLAMDSRGLIDVGRLTVPLGPTDACGFPIHADRLADAAIECLRDADLVLVNFGDSTRLDDMKISLSDKAYADHKLAMMLRLDNLIRRLMEAREKGLCTGIVLVSFSPPQMGYWDRLTPVAVLFDDRQPNLLVSNTTRTQGLIAASDFPTVVERCLGLSSYALFTNGPMDVVSEIDTRVNANHTLILPMLWVFAGVGILSLTVAALAVAFGLPLPKRALRAVRYGMLVAGSACVAMLWAAGVSPGVAQYAIGAVGFALLFAAPGGWYTRLWRSVFGGKAAPVLSVYAFTVLWIVLDAVFGWDLCKFALPCSFQLEGYRYYGIGNEYGAVLVSMSALVVLFCPAGRRAAMAAVLGLVVIFVLGAANLGANYGDAAAAVVTFGLILVALRKGSFGARHVLALLLLGVLASIGFAYADWRISGPAGTHGGRLLGSGLGGVFALAGKKALMNAGLATSHTAQQAILAFLPFVALWFWRIQPKVKAMLAGDDRLAAGLKALVFGAAAAFAMNDSGVVMAGLMIGMTILALVYALLEQESHVKDSCA